MKKLLIIAAIPLMLSLDVWAQSLSRHEANLKEDADIDFEIGDYASALDSYLKILEKHQENGELN